MDSPKIFFAQNIKFLRERKKQTQQQLADELSMTRSKLNALESGQTASPQPGDYLKYSDYFKISVDTLLRVELSKLGELKLRDLQAGNDVYMTGSNLRVLAITVDKKNKENVEYVPIKAKAGYRDGYSDPDYIASLPKVTLPNLPAGTFRMFPITGDSMLPIAEGSDILCQFVEDWTSLKAGTLCIVILRGEQDFVFKKITLVKEEKTVLLESLNEAYAPYTVNVNEILELWKYHSYQSKTIPERVSDVQHISTTINHILERLKGIESKIKE
jgi:transcriptional regulator with XRE-family HTH domain